MFSVLTPLRVGICANRQCFRRASVHSRTLTLFFHGDGAGNLALVDASMLENEVMPGRRPGQMVDAGLLFA